MTMNMRIKRAGINLCLMILAFTIQNCVFPLMPFLTATPNLLLILTFSFGFIEGKQAGMFYGVLAGILLGLVELPQLNGIFPQQVDIAVQPVQPFASRRARKESRSETSASVPPER